MNTAKPTPPEFKLRHLGWVAYGMSVVTGAVGQILSLGEKWGGSTGAWTAAVGLAAFAEVVMIAAGDKSLDHRARRSDWWWVLLILAVCVALYAASMNVTHFISTDPALGFTFGGASMIGFLLHIIDGHIRVGAYLRLLAQYEATPPVKPRRADTTSQPRAARTSTPSRREATAVPTPAPPPAEVGAAPSQDAHQESGDQPPVPLRLVRERTSRRTPAGGSRRATKTDQEVLAVIASYEQQEGGLPTPNWLKTNLGIGPSRAQKLLDKYESPDEQEAIG